MRIPRLPTRPWVAAATVVAAAAILVIVGVGNTHATGPTTPEIPENAPAGTSAGTPMTATVASGTVEYALSGPDADNFTIDPNTGEVKLAAGTSVDYEQKDSYSITVTATADVTVGVENVAESANITLAPDEPRPGDVMTVDIDDPDGGVHSATYRWSRLTPDDIWVVIEGETEATYTVTVEDIGSYISISLQYYDNMGFAGATRRTSRTVKNNPPAFANSSETRQVDENSAAGAAVGAPVTATDPDATTVRHSLTGDNNFAVDEQTGQITVAAGAALDHEAQDLHTVRIKATDANGGTDYANVSITVDNVDEAGTVSLQHGTLTPGAVITAAITDPDGDVSDVSWQWQRGSDHIADATAASYTATGDDVGQYLTAVVSYTDGHGPGKSASAATTSAVVNDAPTFSETAPQRAIDENAPVGTSVGAAVTATDANDDDLKYSLDDANFAIDQSGNITSAAVFDHEDASSHSVEVTATDEHDAAASVTVEITVNNLDEAGAVALDNTGPKVGDTVTATLTDPDGSTSGQTWQWQHGDGATWTDITDANASAYTVQSADIGKLLQASVGYTDPHGAGKSASAHTTANVANDPPTFTTAGPVAVSINENNSAGANIGTALAASDPNDDALTFTVEGTDAAKFAIDANGQMTATAALDHEAQSSHSFTAKVSDPAGGSDTLAVAVTVVNVEEPGVVTLDAETAEVGTKLTAALADPDGSIAGQTWQWQRAESANGPWTDIEDATSAAYTPTADDVDLYLLVNAAYTDGHGSDADTASATTGAVQREPNRPPAFDDATTEFSISINVREGIRVAPPFTATDPNDDTLTYSIVSDTADAFTVNSATGEVLMGSAEMSVDTTYTATISVTDSMDDERNADTSADDSLSLTMTMVNPNIVVSPSSTRAFPNGLWVDTNIVVTTNEGSSEDWTLFYDRHTQAELEDRNFEITTPRFAAPKGVWSDGTTLYLLVINEGSHNHRGKIYGYSLETGNRRSGKDINLANGNRNAYGLTGRDGRLYVTDSADDKVYAYDVATRSRASDHDINGIDRMNKQMTDLWLNDETVWVSYWRSDFIRAYDVTTGAHKPGLDIQTAAENRGPTGIDSDGFHFWALDQVNDTIYGYVLPQ